MSQTLDNLSYTWNNAGTTFTGIKYNVTDTASAAGSLLMDLQVGGSSQFSIRKDAVLILPATSTLAFSNTSNGTFGSQGVSFFYSAGLDANVLQVRRTGQTTNLYGFSYAGINLGTAKLGFGSDTTSPNQDVILLRDAANTLAQRNGTNAQTFRIYNTYTDASNYERAKYEWDSNVFKIGTEKAGTGTARSFDFVVGGTSVIQLLSSASNVTGTRLYTPANGKLAVMTSGNGAGTLCFGLGTSSFAEIMGNGTKLEVRLGNDGALTNIQGKLTTDANAVAETPTATHTLTIYDAAGTAYKVLAVAA